MDVLTTDYVGKKKKSSAAEELIEGLDDNATEIFPGTIDSLQKIGI